MSRLGAYARTFTGFSRDGRLFLLFTLVAGAATSLYWVDFNLYLAALGVHTPTIGIIATAGSAAGALIAFPASAVSDRIGRRPVYMGGAIFSALFAFPFFVLVNTQSQPVIYFALILGIAVGVAAMFASVPASTQPFGSSTAGAVPERAASKRRAYPAGTVRVGQ